MKYISKSCVIVNIPTEARAFSSTGSALPNSVLVTLINVNPLLNYKIDLCQSINATFTGENDMGTILDTINFNPSSPSGSIPNEQQTFIFSSITWDNAKQTRVVITYTPRYTTIYPFSPAQNNIIRRTVPNL